MIRVVLKHLNHSHPALRFVVDLRLAAKGKDAIVLVHAEGHVREGLAIDASIGVNCHEETDLVKGKLQVIKGVLDRLIKVVQFPSVVESIQQPREKKLGITLATIACAGTTVLTWQASFYYDHILQLLSSVLVNACNMETVTLDEQRLHNIDIVRREHGHTYRIVALLGSQ